MKLALITDTHWGVRNDNRAFLENSKKFLDNVFFPYLTDHNIKDVVHLGDIVDRRKYTNTYTLNRLRRDFIDPLMDRGIKLDLILGNHDTYFKNTNDINLPMEVFQERYPGFTIYDEAETVDFDGVPILFIPWICDDNRERTLKEITETSAQIVMGHLEIQGFEMYRGSTVSHGDDRSSFDRFDLVFSGHYHHRSTDGHIFYLGSHAEFTWSDYDDPRGFHIFDTETRELTFIENPYKMFRKVWYNENLEAFTDYEQFKGCMVKVVVQKKTDLYAFDKFVENIENAGPIDLQIVEDHLNLNLEDDEDIVNEAESTLDIFTKYIDGSDMEKTRKKSLQKKIVEIYNEALTIE